MKNLIMMVTLGLAFVLSTPVFAGSQQDKMIGCNIEAKADKLKGDARKAFMQKCLAKAYTLKDSTKLAVEVRKKEKAACKAEATEKGLKDKEHKKFVKSCYKK